MPRLVTLDARCMQVRKVDEERSLSRRTARFPCILLLSSVDGIFECSEQLEEGFLMHRMEDPRISIWKSHANVVEAIWEHSRPLGESWQEELMNRRPFRPPDLNNWVLTTHPIHSDTVGVLIDSVFAHALQSINVQQGCVHRKLGQI